MYHMPLGGLHLIDVPDILDKINMLPGKKVTLQQSNEYRWLHKDLCWWY